MSSQYDKLGEMLKDALASGEIPQEQTERKSTEYAANAPADEVPPVFSSQKEADVSAKERETVNANAERKFVSVEPAVIRAYAVLKLENGAPPERAKDAYRRLLKKYHPDNTAKYENMQKTAAKKTDEVVKAYKTLENWFERKTLRENR
ncbi:MAG: J domain-containing protein [Treponema sp.]